MLAVRSLADVWTSCQDYLYRTNVPIFVYFLDHRWLMCSRDTSTAFCIIIDQCLPIQPLSVVSLNYQR